MRIVPIGPEQQAAALAYLRASPYRNALPLSNITQLRAQCDALMAERAGRVVGVATTYHDLPIPNLTFAAERDDHTVGALLAALAERNPALRAPEAFALLPQDRYTQLGRHVHILGAQIEYQMAIEPETLRAPDGPPARRLGPADVPAMTALAAEAGLGVWHERTIQLGPAFGCFAGERLVAMAATHFATAEVVEIGHIATHPAFRRRGYASAATAALAKAAFGLAPRVFLMVLDDNTPALAAYKALGFRPIEAFHLTNFRFHSASQ